jgi:hypothetical protein
MICVTQVLGESQAAEAADGWSTFANTQHLADHVVGYISQLTHANLAGQIAAALDERLFGELPKSVIETIARHDVGWAELDLSALEHVSEMHPDSFLRASPRCAIAAWEQSIAAAERMSPLAFYLTGKHFYLLAPRDGDADHQAFIEKYEARLDSEGASGYSEYSEVDLHRFVAALGFCDLISLHLCSGSCRSVRIPLAHPADPMARNARQVTITATSTSVHLNLSGAWRPGVIAIDGWLTGRDHRLTAKAFQWNLT